VVLKKYVPPPSSSDAKRCTRRWCSSIAGEPAELHFSGRRSRRGRDVRRRPARPDCGDRTAAARCQRRRARSRESQALVTNAKASSLGVKTDCAWSSRSRRRREPERLDALANGGGAAGGRPEAVTRRLRLELGHLPNRSRSRHHLRREAGLSRRDTMPNGDRGLPRASAGNPQDVQRVGSEAKTRDPKSMAHLHVHTEYSMLDAPRGS